MTIRVMFVDDEEDQLFTYQKILEMTEKDYIFIGLNSGEECLKKLEDGVIPDIIFLDIMMPERSGWEVFDTIKDNPNWDHIPIIFLTARKDYIAKNAGGFLAEEYIEKPVNHKDLLQCIEKFINKKKAIKNNQLKIQF